MAIQKSYLMFNQTHTCEAHLEFATTTFKNHRERISTIACKTIKHC